MPPTPWSRQTQLIPEPAALAWEVAGALNVAGTTAWAAVRAVDPGPGDVVAVSAATGGVGTLVGQLIVRRGATVLGIASRPSAGWLSAHGATPVEYGDGVGDRLRDAAPDGIDAFIDLFGPEYVRLAIDLGVRPDRVNTVVVSDAARELGVRMDGSGALSPAAIPEVLRELAELLASGALQLPVASTYRLDPTGATGATGRAQPVVSEIDMRMAPYRVDGPARRPGCRFLPRLAATDPPAAGAVAYRRAASTRR